MLKKINARFILFMFVSRTVITNPELVIQSVKNGMLVCYNNVIPSLYIFMVIANYRAQPEIMNLLSLPFRWYGRLMKNEDNFFSGCLILSIIGGFAVGANYLQMFEKRGCSQNVLKVISVAMINNSFAFTVFTVGTNCLGNTACGLLIYSSLIASSMITAFIFSFIFEYNIVTLSDSEHQDRTDLTSSIKKAVDSVLVICGFVIVFNFVCEVISLYTYKYNSIDSFLTVFSEVTCGTLKLLTIYGKNIYFLCFALSIFPICTLCQVYHFTHNKAVIKTLLLSRAIHTPVSLLILNLLSNLFPSAAYVSSNVSPSVAFVSDSMEISAIIFMITVVFLIIFEDNKLFTNSGK